MGKNKKLATMEGLTEEQKSQISQKRAEALAQAEEAFRKLDLDGSGEIERNELQELARSSGSAIGGGENDINDFINTFDTDGDGKVSLQEWLTFFGNMFDQVIAAGMAGGQ